MDNRLAHRKSAKEKSTNAIGGKKMIKNLKYVSAIAMCILVLTLVASSQVWPKRQGVYIAKSSASIPTFPRVLREFRFAGKNKDYWGESFDTDGSTRIFEGNDWEELSEFPHTMNHCSDGVWMLRWRSANPAVRISTGIANNTYDQGVSNGKTGNYGYMSGTNCEQPYFKFARATGGNGSNLVDIYYESPLNNRNLFTVWKESRFF